MTIVYIFRDDYTDGAIHTIYFRINQISTNRTASQILQHYNTNERPIIFELMHDIAVKCATGSQHIVLHPSEFGRLIYSDRRGWQTNSEKYHKTEQKKANTVMTICSLFSGLQSRKWSGVLAIAGSKRKSVTLLSATRVLSFWI